ncbi:MAG: PhnD/SsuA/transferrin family substrate-binding protein [Gammaproteobacteria bacterium]
MSAPPRENQQQAEALYNPLAKVFTEILGRPVRYVYPDNWLTYQREMRRGKYDIAFDGPHFASWRIKHLGHDLLVKLTGNIEFVTVIRKRNKNVESLDDLIGKKICSISPPNLSALTILDTYKNPVQQPILFGIRGGMVNVFDRFSSGACDAAVIRRSFYKKKLSMNDRDKIKILHESLPLPNQAFTVSNKLSGADVAKLASAIQYGVARSVITPIAQRFGGENAEFLAAETAEYIEPRLLLEGVILGW